MARVKRGKAAHKRRKNVLKHTKGFRWGRKSKYRLAKDATQHAWEYAFRDRKAKKREKRSLWQIQINAACRKSGVSYSKFIFYLRKNKIGVDRKILADLSRNHPQILEKMAEGTKSK